MLVNNRKQQNAAKIWKIITPFELGYVLSSQQDEFGDERQLFI